MLVERVNCYVTKGLKIMCNERNSVRVALEAILIFLCTELLPSAWDRHFLQFSGRWLRVCIFN